MKPGLEDSWNTDASPKAIHNAIARIQIQPDGSLALPCNLFHTEAPVRVPKNVGRPPTSNIQAYAQHLLRNYSLSPPCQALGRGRFWASSRVMPARHQGTFVTRSLSSPVCRRVEAVKEIGRPPASYSPGRDESSCFQQTMLPMSHSLGCEQTRASSSMTYPSSN